MSISAWMLRPSSCQSSASGFSRVPRHAPHSVYARYFESSTRMCILYALVSSHLKKRRTPYQVPGQDLRQLSHSGSPSSTQVFWSAVRSRNDTSSGTLRFFAYFSRSSWHSLKLGLCHGRTAPSRSVFASSGTTRPKSTPITRPKPRRVAHHRFAAAAAVELGRAREQELQVVVELRHRADRRARGAHGIRLVDGDCRRNAFDCVDLRLVHAVEELPRVRAEGLDVAALAFGIQRVEDERGLPGAGNARDDDELAGRDR